MKKGDCNGYRQYWPPARPGLLVPSCHGHMMPSTDPFSSSSSLRLPFSSAGNIITSYRLPCHGDMDSLHQGSGPEARSVSRDFKMPLSRRLSPHRRRFTIPPAICSLVRRATWRLIIHHLFAHESRCRIVRPSLHAALALCLPIVSAKNALVLPSSAGDGQIEGKRRVP